MFYKIIVPILKGLFWLFNGPSHIEGLDKLPQDQPLILASTHRSLFDPFYIAFALYPQPIHFMAKDSLFDKSWMNYLLTKAGMFPVNRDHPSTASLRTAVNYLKKDREHLGIFPSGSRYATEIKGGTSFIQRRAKAAIIPITIQPPLNFKEFFSRKQAKLAFGQAIAYDPNLAYNKEDLKAIDQKLAQAFDDLDQSLDPNYHYLPQAKN